jgi:hypothetical protein
MIYLASPYSADIPNNYRKTLRLAARLWREGHLAFSPILLCHEAAARHDLPTDAVFWWRMNSLYLGAASRLWIAPFSGWDTSAGVKMELELARELGIPIEYVELLDGEDN